MERIELVELVREKAGVGYADAKEALDANGDDLLDALVWLEVQGRSQTRSAYASTGAPAPGGVSSEMRAAQSAYARSSAAAPRAVAGWFSRVRDACARFWRRGMESRVVSRREDGLFVRLPLLPAVVGLALWIFLDLQALGRGFCAYDLLILLLQLAAILMPVVCFFYLVFACRIERPEGQGQDCPAAPAAGRPVPPAPEAPVAEPETAVTGPRPVDDVAECAADPEREAEAAVDRGSVPDAVDPDAEEEAPSHD